MNYCILGKTFCLQAIISNKIVLVVISVLLAVIVFLTNPFDVPLAGNKVIAIAVLMITLWVTESLPMPVVALLPLVLFPLFKIAPLDATASSFANPVIFLFLGGFLLGLAIEKWNLHRRIALNIVRLTGTSGNRIILGFILATGLISMWLSNTATTMMMFPIALSVIHVMKENQPDTTQVRNFSLGIMLSIALASNFGGISTIIGTPPNVAYAAFMQKQYGYTISFVDWMIFCVPIALVLMAVFYLVMVKWIYPNNMPDSTATNELIRSEIAALGKMSLAEKRVLIIFTATATLWICRELINELNLIRLDDTMIALIGGISLFVAKAGKGNNQSLLDWDDTKKMAWGILLLFGGGIALASALENAGLIQQMGAWFNQFTHNTLLLIFLVTVISLFVSEVMSNVAQVIVFAPVVAALAVAVGLHPMVLGVPMTLAASCASMLPMGTPPNAIAFSSGYIKLNQMTKVGFIMNIIAVVLITLVSWIFLPMIFKT